MKRIEFNLSEFLDCFDFSYEKIENDFKDVENDDEGLVYKLIDNQGANLGGIEEERFSTIPCIIDRLDTYYNDYIYEDARQEYGIWGNTAEELFHKIEELNDDKLTYHYSLLYYILNPTELKEG